MTTGKVTVFTKVRDYMAKHPDAKPAEVSDALGLNKGSVNAAMSKVRHPTKTAGGKKSTSVVTQDPLDNLKSIAAALQTQIAEEEARITNLNTLRMKLARTTRAITELERDTDVVGDVSTDITDPARVAGGEQHATA